MDFPLGNAFRIYGVYVLLIFAVIGVLLLPNMTAAPLDGPSSNTSNTEGPLPMAVFIKDIICSNGSGKIIIQSWDYNDYPLPDVSLEISDMGNFTTSYDGTGTINGLNNGTYHVSASKSGYEKKSFEFTISCPMKRIIIRPSTNK
jgi:hypothetical protein